MFTPISKSKNMMANEAVAAPNGVAAHTARGIQKVGALGCALALMGAAFSAPSFAFDPEKTFKADEEPRMILRYGYNALKEGKMDDAVGAFRFGAKRNNLASQWKLAEMLQHGSGVKQNHAAAHKLYAQIADRFSTTAPLVHDTPYVTHALVALGKYSLSGIEGTKVRRNPRVAEHYFMRAAALYKDPEAQFQLGRLYRSEKSGLKQPYSAVRWLGLAARKGHLLAQAELGEMLFYGEGVRRRPVQGLVLIARAAARLQADHVRAKQDRAFANANEAQRNEASRIIAGLNVESSGAVSAQPAAQSD